MGPPFFCPMGPPVFAWPIEFRSVKLCAFIIASNSCSTILIRYGMEIEYRAVDDDDEPRCRMQQFAVDNGFPPQPASLSRVDYLKIRATIGTVYRIHLFVRCLLSCEFRFAITRIGCGPWGGPYAGKSVSRPSCQKPTEALGSAAAWRQTATRQGGMAARTPIRR